MIAAHGFDEPQRRVDRIIFRRSAAIGKAIGQHAPIDVSREGAQNGGGELGTSGRQREPGQRDHRVAPPVAEPVIAGDHGCTGLRFDAARDDERVGSEDERFDPRRRLRHARVRGVPPGDELALTRMRIAGGGVSGVECSAHAPRRTGLRQLHMNR